MKYCQFRWWGFVLIFVTLGTATTPVGADSFVTIGVDSRAFGTVNARWGTGWRVSDSCTLGTGVLVSVPALLIAKGGGLDSLALDLEGFLEREVQPGWFLRGRLATGVVTQDQILGAMLSWTGSLSFEPGFRDEWGEFWLLVRPEAALITVIRPSSYTAATFDDRYSDEATNAGSRSILLGLTAARFLGGVGTQLKVTEGVLAGLVVGVYPPLRSEWVGWFDGFSFGEIPFYASLECRFELF